MANTMVTLAFFQSSGTHKNTKKSNDCLSMLFFHATAYMESCDHIAHNNYNNKKINAVFYATFGQCDHFGIWYMGYGILYVV